MPLETFLKEAKKKHVGLDNYWLAVSFAKAEEIVKLPRMVKPLILEKMKLFYKEKAKWLINENKPD